MCCTMYAARCMGNSVYRAVFVALRKERRREARCGPRAPRPSRCKQIEKGKYNMIKNTVKSRSMPPVLLAALLAGLLLLAGCQWEPLPPSPSDLISSAQLVGSGERESDPAPGESAAQPGPEESSQPEQEPQPPEPQYSEWVLGEWVTEPLEEGDLCRLANTRTQETQTWGSWSEWSVEPVDASDIREVQTKVEKGRIIDFYQDVPMVDRYGYETDQRATIPVYKMDEYGYWIYEETTHYRYRDLTTPVTTTQYQYETRQITNQAELDSWQEQFAGE